MDEKEHSIRFINSSYDTLFRIPDGGTVEVQFPDRKFSAKCEYIDDYHTLVSDSVFHICEFAEMVERQHGSVRPEPETELDQAAWQLGHREFLALQTTDSGYDYTFYSMNQARDQIMEMHGYGRRNRAAVPYDRIMEQAELANSSVLKQLDDLKGHSAQRQKTGKEVHHAGKER